MKTSDVVGSTVRLAAFAGVLATLLMNLRPAWSVGSSSLSQSGALRQIYLEACPDSVSGSNDDVGETVEECVDDVGDLSSRAEMRDKCKLALEARLENLYECKACPVGEHGCESSIVSDGFSDEECTMNDIPSVQDCDGDGEPEYYQVMKCSSTTYDWTYACAACVKD